MSSLFGSPSLRSRSAAVVLSVVLLSAGAELGQALGAPHAPSQAVTVTRESLASAAHPRGADKRTLGLSRVTIMPGTRLAQHHHPGTQIGYVERGVLSYTVDTGRARLMAGTGDDPRLVRVIHSGQTARVHPGQWLVEQATDHHHAANRGAVPVVIYLATLFGDGEPASLPG
jgi:mannose-6-phosphate isomerase-like protein (cupin superfamily)